MTDKPQYSVTLLPGNEVRFWSLSRKAKVKPENRPMGAERYHSQAAAMFSVEHYKATGKILLHDEVKAILVRQKQQRRAAQEKLEPRAVASMRRRQTGEQAQMRL